MNLKKGDRVKFTKEARDMCYDADNEIHIVNFAFSCEIEGSCEEDIIIVFEDGKESLPEYLEKERS